MLNRNWPSYMNPCHSVVFLKCNHDRNMTSSHSFLVIEHSNVEWWSFNYQHQTSSDHLCDQHSWQRHCGRDLCPFLQGGTAWRVAESDGECESSIKRAVNATVFSKHRFVMGTEDEGFCGLRAVGGSKKIVFVDFGAFVASETVCDILWSLKGNRNIYIWIPNVMQCASVSFLTIISRCLLFSLLVLYIFLSLSWIKFVQSKCISNCRSVRFIVIVVLESLPYRSVYIACWKDSHTWNCGYENEPALLCIAYHLSHVFCRNWITGNPIDETTSRP